MGLLRRAWDWLTVADALPPAGRPATFAITGPMPIDDMWRSLHDPNVRPVERQRMLTIPGVARARDEVCTIATLPLREVDGRRRPVANALLEQIDPDVPNVVTMAQLVEDLFADGIAWLEVLDTDPAGRPRSARRRDPNTVTLQPEGGDRAPAPLPSGFDPRGGVVYVDGRQVPAARMRRFDSPKPPARVIAAQTMRRAAALGDAAAMYAENPRPLDYFRPADGFTVNPDDPIVISLLKSWQAARRRRATAFVPAQVDYQTVDAITPADLQLVELQRQVALDLAIQLGLDPEDVGVPTTTRTYQNAVDRRQDRINRLLSFYMRAITDRMTMPDFTPRGHRVVFDLDDFLRADPRTRWEVYQMAHGIGVLDAEDIAAEEDLPQRPAGGRTARRLPPAASPPARPRVAAGRDAPQIADILPINSTATFAQPDRSATDLPVVHVGFAVDSERRTIRGRVIPYGDVSAAGFARYEFLPGSVYWPAETGRVKVLEDHSWALAFGRAVDITDGPDGLDAVLRVGRGEHGDRMLALAQDGVKDGLSAGVDLEEVRPHPAKRGVLQVVRARLNEITLTAGPKFDNARVTSVAAARTQEGSPMHCEHCGGQHAAGVACPTAPPTATPAPAAPATENTTTATFSMDALAAALAAHLPGASGQPAGSADPGTGAPPSPAADPAALPVPAHLSRTRSGTTMVREPSPYQFGRNTSTGETIMTDRTGHDFSADLLMCMRAGDTEWETQDPATDAGRRVRDFLAEQFAVVTTDVNELAPEIQRPDMYVDQRDYRTPLWNFVNKGAPPNGVQPFRFPKFSSASGLVGDHTEGVEPATGTFTTTSQVVNPTAISGAADISRETWDIRGNPAISTLIFNQMRRGWRESLESATATFLNTLTAATDITLTTAAADDDLASDWYAALADLQFVRGYDFTAFALEKVLFKQFVDAVGADNRPLFPMIGPANANGTAARRFTSIDLGGVTGVPSWALASTPASANNSWLFDPSVVHGWATAPQRLEFAGIDADGDYAPVAMIRIAIWGYKAFANSDIGGVRQVIYDWAA